ncbi:MAG: cryptochrome/photolyase family protein, partial [Methylobacterium sp.]|nr:cryptochrome/photolyase family protein [Methylobacterium sp.]
MKILRLVLGDQLTRSISSLADLEPARDVVLMVEVAAEATYVRHHKQKIALIFSAMRHFAEELRGEGITVDYVTLEDQGNTGSFEGELRRALLRHEPDRVIVTEPGEWRVWQMMLEWRETMPAPVEIRADDRFVATRDEFAAWAKGRK